MDGLLVVVEEDYIVTQPPLMVQVQHLLLVEDVQVEISGPPILIGALFGGRRGHPAVHDGAFGIAVVVVHGGRLFSGFIRLSFA